MSTFDILIIISIICMYVSFGLTNYSLRKQNIHLKKKLSDLALETGNDIYAIYNISEEDKLKMIDLKKGDNKIAAINLLKTNYNMCLFDAKTYIDLL